MKYGDVTRGSRMKWHICVMD